MSAAGRLGRDAHNDTLPSRLAPTSLRLRTSARSLPPPAALICKLDGSINGWVRLIGRLIGFDVGFCLRKGAWATFFATSGGVEGGRYATVMRLRNSNRLML
jgi:hypothetical protein